MELSLPILFLIPGVPLQHPNPKKPQTPPQPPNYPDPDEGTSDDEDDSEETLGGELSGIGGCSDRVEEGDRIFVTMHMLPETVGATSTISQQIAEESAKDNPKWEKSLHDMIPPCFWGHMDIFAKKFFDSLPERCPWDHAIELTGDHWSPPPKALSPVPH